MASSRRALISVVPQENSTVTFFTPAIRKIAARHVHKLCRNNFSFEIGGYLNRRLSSGTQSTHRAGLLVARL